MYCHCSDYPNVFLVWDLCLNGGWVSMLSSNWDWMRSSGNTVNQSSPWRGGSRFWLQKYYHQKFNKTTVKKKKKNRRCSNYHIISLGWETKDQFAAILNNSFDRRWNSNTWKLTIKNQWGENRPRKILRALTNVSSSSYSLSPSSDNYPLGNTQQRGKKHALSTVKDWVWCKAHVFL